MHGYAYNTPAGQGSAGDAAPLPFATPADVRRLERELAAMRLLMQEFMNSLDEEVSTAQALKITGIKSRTTLIAERDRPGTTLKYTKMGRSTAYSRAGCVAYKLAHRMGSESSTARLNAFFAQR